MRPASLLASIMALGLSAPLLRADTLILRDGKEVNGTLLGATTRQIEFLPASGMSIRVPLDTVSSIDLSRAVAPDKAVAPAARPASKKAVRIRAGTAFRVRTKGSDLIGLKVNAIVVRGRRYAVVTSVSESKSAGEGKKSAGKILGGAGLGAIIGGVAGGGKGAGIGALVGGAGGTVLALTSQPHLKVPPETRLQFQFLSDWKVE